MAAAAHGGDVRRRPPDREDSGEPSADRPAPRHPQRARGPSTRIAERAQRLHDRGQQPGIVAAAEPLTIGDPDSDVDELDPATLRVGWKELLSRADTLSWACVEQALLWKGGRRFAFAHPTEVDTSTDAGGEWAARLEPVDILAAAFACLNTSGRGVKGRALVDPLTDAPAVLTGEREHGGAVTAVPQRLPATAELDAVILDKPIWIRTADGNLDPAPKDPAHGLNWGYSGGGPGALALLIHRLLDDITAQAAEYLGDAPAGLDQLTEHRWPRGTVLPRPLLEAARDGHPYHHP